jgi:hypothetical protein
VSELTIASIVFPDVGVVAHAAVKGDALPAYDWDWMTAATLTPYTQART